MILLGHSLGASIAPMVTVEHPELVSGLVLLSGSLDPELGKPRWYNWLASFPIVKYAIPDMLLKANKEIHLLNQALADIDDKWSQINVPVSVVQGKQDKLVNPDNVKFARSKLAGLGDRLKIIELENAGHFLPWENTETIASTIIALNP